MKAIYTIIFITCLSIFTYAQIRNDVPVIKNVAYETKGDVTSINFTLHSTNPDDKFEVWIEPVEKPGNLNQIAISGDIGRLSPGLHQINWDTKQQKLVPVTLYAQLLPKVETGKALGLSLLYPGSGSHKLDPSKKKWYMGAIGYGLIATSLIMNQMSKSDYNNYKDVPPTNSEADKLFNSAQQKQMLSYGFAAGAGLVWTIDLVSVLSKSKKLKNTPPQKLKLDPTTYPLLSHKLEFSSSGTSNVGLNDKQGPVIHIISPQFERGFEKTTQNSSVLIQGEARDNSGIKSVSINKIPLKVSPTGSFQTNLPLKQGDNLVNISATDKQGNSSGIELKFVRKSGGVSGKEIIWQSPVVDNITTASNTYPVEACVAGTKDVNQISIYCNNELISQELSRQVDFRGSCEFSIKKTVPLILGNNLIRIVATTSSEEIVSEKNITYDIGAQKYYALLIAVEDYSDPEINDLSEPVKDAEKLAKTLIENYSFEKENVKILRNPSKSEIIGTLHKLRSFIKENDNFLIFYAGHGFWDEDMKSGYWLPSNAQRENPVDWLPNAVLTNYLGAIKSKHTLLIADACFSGGIFKTRSAFNNRTAIEKLYQMPSRKAMTSGTLKEVPDKSVFIEYFIKRLNDNEDDYLTSEQLFSSMRVAIMNNSPNVPQYGTIQNTGDEGGDFIFVKRKNK